MAISDDDAVLPPPGTARPPGVGDCFQRYRLLRELGAGGGGRVLLARDPELQRDVAIKLLHSSSGNAGKRLLLEARAMAHLSHPNVIEVFDTGQIGSTVFIVMELVDGGTLREWIDEGAHPWPDVVERFVAAGRGLEAAHAAGLIHRDFKPSNVLVDAAGRVRVTDFGLARWDDSEGMAEDGPHDTASPRITRVGAVLGTPYYMAPEQHRAADADARSDQYAFSVSMFEALHGTLPFTTKSDALADDKEHGRITTRRRRGVPGWLDEVVLRGLSPIPADRWPSMGAMLAAIERGANRGRRRFLVIAAPVIGLAAVSVAWFLLGRGPCDAGADQVQAVWNDESRASIRAAFLQTGLGFAAGTWSRLDARIDAYAGAWTDEYRTACEAQADSRLRCLAERRRGLNAMVRALVEADADTIENSLQLFEQLPPVSPCEEETAPAPHDPEVARRVETARDALAGARAMLALGRYADGLAVLEQLTVPEYAPLQVETALLQARLLSATADYSTAAVRARSAYFAAQEHGLDDAAARCAIELAGIDTLAGHYESARWWTDHAAAAVQRSSRPELEAHLLHNAAFLHQKLGDLDLSISELERSLQMRRDTLGESDVDTVSSMNDIGSFLLEAGRYSEALRYLEPAYELRRQQLGALHPHVAQSRLNIAAAYAGQRDFGRALAEHRGALATLRQALGPAHPDVALALANLGAMQMGSGELDAALETYDQVLAIVAPDAPLRAPVLTNIGNVYKARNDHGSALEQYRLALEAFESTLGPQHPALVRVLAAMGDELGAIGRREEARAVLARAKDLVTEASPMDAALVEFTSARLQWAAGERAEARTRAERALQHLLAADAPAQDVAELRRWLVEHPE